MDSNRFKLPSLNALKAFHAVARHGSIRGAAKVLSVTPQAVSGQIRLLEEALQVTLFERRGRSIESNKAAVLLARYVKAGFEELSEGVRRVTRQKCRDRINLNVSPYFATRGSRRCTSARWSTAGTPTAEELKTSATYHEMLPAADSRTA